MGLLVIVILAIIMMSFVTFAGINYLKLEPYTVIKYEKQIESGFMQLLTGFYAYKSMYGVNLATTDWKTKLDNINIKIPASIETATWTYNKTNNGKIYFCLSGTLSDLAYKGASNYATRSSDAIFINTSCGALENSTALSQSTANPKTFSVTFWVTK